MDKTSKLLLFWVPQKGGEKGKKTAGGGDGIHPPCPYGAKGRVMDPVGYGFTDILWIKSANTIQKISNAEIRKKGMDHFYR